MVEAMSGWEIDEHAINLMQNDEQQTIVEFTAAYGPLAAFDAERNVLAVIRRFHPTLNCSPDHELYASDDYSIRISLTTIMSSMFFYVPKSLTYERLSLVPQFGAAGLPVDFSITTEEHGTVISNTFELESVLAPGLKPLPEAEMLAAFRTLINARAKPRIPVTSTRIHLPSIGDLEHSDFDDWWTITVPVPMLDQSLPLTVQDFNPDDPMQQAQSALFDAAARAFLAAGPEALVEAGPRVLANCHDYIEAVGEQDWNRDMAACRDPAAIWQFVHPKAIYLVFHRATGRVYVTVACECDWEQEHGLQLVYRDGATLSRVSEQDGHPVG
jgi:hypothetical protein